MKFPSRHGWWARVHLLPALGQSPLCPASPLLQPCPAFWQSTGVKFAVILLNTSWKLTFCHCIPSLEKEFVCWPEDGMGHLISPPTLQLQQHVQGSRHLTQRTTHPLSSQNLFLNSYLNLATKLYHRWSRKTNSLLPKELDIQRQKGQQEVQTQLGNLQ